jgi:hypothetical protein
MAITVIIEPTVHAVSGLETRFTASGPFVLYGDGFAGDERCSLERLGPSGTYIKARSEKGMIKVGAYPNMVYVDAPGSYQLVKSTTRTAASVGIQSPHALELFVNTDEYLELKMAEFLSANTGIWYDPQDLTTLFQDAQGTLPVYMPGTGQVDPPVGLMLDKSGGGYHASQNTTTARPTLSGRYNLLTATETLATQSVTTEATDYTLSFSGEGTVTLSGTATGTYSAGTHTITCTKGTLTCTVDGSVTEADLRVKRDGSSLPAYQAVVDADNYDTEGFPLFLKRDKVDDDLIVKAPAITGAWAHGTIDGPVIGTVAIPDGEYHPFGTELTYGLPDCTQWIAIDGTLSASEQAVFERYVYSKSRQLTNVPQFGGVSDISFWFRARADITSIDSEDWDTSNVTVFQDAWIGCSGLTSFPALDTSNGTNFIGAWYGCTGLTSFPVLDTNNGTNFTHAWYGCSGLTSFPLLDVSSGTSFQSAWSRCSGLTSFPELDTSSGTNFTSAWHGCSGLTSFPALDVSSGTNFNSTWRRCSGLTSFPELDTSSGTNFSSTWFGCSGLTSFPALDVSNGTDFTSAWRNCSGLTSFPANFFDNCLATGFTDAFISTNLSQESIDGILVSINSNATSNGTFDQSGGSAPSAAGEAAITAMRSRGWTVNVTGGFAGDLVFSFGLDNVDSFSFDLQTKTDTAPVLIDWGDGTQSTHAGTTDQTASHTYAASGTYAVKVYGVYGADQSMLTKFSTSDDGMSGDLVMPSGMTYFYCSGSNTLSGTLSIPSGMTYFVCEGSNTLSGYTPSAKASNQARFLLTGQNTLSATDVDNILIDYDAAGGTWTGEKEITIQGNAEDRTSDSDAAYDSLAIKLDTLDVD